jgi:hypothetical protein
MMKTTLIFLALICHTALFAQSKHRVIIPAGTNVMETLASADVFYYPKFIAGKVFFKDGSKSEARLNYNSLLDEMQFIDAKKDTLSLADENTIAFIAFDKDVFYYDKGYVRLVTGNQVAKLAVKQVWRVVDKRKSGVYNTTSPASSSTSFSSYFVYGKQHDLIVNQELDMVKVEQYYLGDKNNHILVAAKKNLLMLFPKEREELESFLKDNKINFTDKEDLEKIVAFMGKTEGGRP